MSDDNNQLNTAVTPTPNPVGGNVSDSTTSVPAQAATSTTNTPPITAKAIGLPKSNPKTARVAPNESAPTSPSQIRAGKTLK